jgi:hypothetical protein
MAVNDPIDRFKAKALEQIERVPGEVKVVFEFFGESFGVRACAYV